MTDISLIEAARERLAPVVRRTPLLSSEFLDEIAGRRVFVKAECLQHTGSFKFRGAWSRLSAMSEAERARGVIAYSSGNHAQGVARAAKLFGVPAVIIMPSDAPGLKVANTRAYGAAVVQYDRATESREQIGLELAEARGLTLVKPYDDPLVIAGQGTAGLEIAEQAAEAGIASADVLVPCGGGGLTAGIALALAARAPDLTVHPCEPQGFDDTTRSLVSGHRESNESLSGSACDAILTPEPGEITFPHIKAHCGPGLVVSDEEALKAVALAQSRLKIVLEPGGAVALAAALFHGEKLGKDTVIAVASGGNIDPGMLCRALEIA